LDFSVKVGAESGREPDLLSDFSITSLECFNECGGAEPGAAIGVAMGVALAGVGVLAGMVCRQVLDS
jgi:hypothetical protein